ncbi:MAG: sulfite exporter TauE/SafE family protein [Thermodesulfobacteriota bacterium]
MLFPQSGVEVSPFIPPLVAFVVSFFTSMGGVSGAFLLLPFQVSYLGFSSPAVSSTNLVFNIVAIPSGIYRYLREGRMSWPLTWVVVVGTLPGVAIGAWLRIRYFLEPRYFKLFVGLVLLYIGARLVLDLAGRSRRAKEESKRAEAEFNRRLREKLRVGKGAGAVGVSGPDTSVRTVEFSLGRIIYTFYGETFSFPTWGVFALSFIVGIIGGTYGIGGGAIVAPFFVAVFRLPVYTVAGAALAGTFITSVFGVVFYQFMLPLFAPANLPVAPDWLLGLLFGLGGLAGVYCGARLQKFIPAAFIKAMLALIVLGTAGKYILGFWTA